MAVQQPMEDGVDLGLDVGGANDVLIDRGNRRAFRGDFNPGGPEQKLVGKSLDPLWEGGAEQEVLA